MIDFTARIQSKIISRTNLSKLLHQWQFKNQTIVFTNGCFDILHQGHVEYLAKAGSLGQQLIVGVNADESVKRLKGPSRPINSEYSRAIVLASLEFVSAVVVFEEDTPLELVKEVRPDFIVKGGDYTPETVVGKEYAKEVVIIPLLDGFSTTKTIQSIANH